MKTITINTEGITEQQKTTAKFQSFYQGVLSQLNVPGFIDVLCAHEAAHVFYFILAGSTQFEPHQTTISYDPKIDDYVSNLAGIQLLDLTMWTQGDFWPWLHKIACAHACGGVVARKLMPSSEGGDQDDKDRFKQLCDQIGRIDPGVKIDFEPWWKQGQQTVSEMIEKPEVMAEIKRIAADLRPQFGL
jgi:hypothetical protein